MRLETDIYNAATNQEHLPGVHNNGSIFHRGSRKLSSKQLSP